ncbi:MAG: hypothetical protein HZY75_06765 [Nocardioidaceae bacterium]|nr:MAG: hypothetical protein HZY75_06765 [Nocardioidaceae bacterium]
MSPVVKLALGLLAVAVVLGLIGVPWWGILLIVLGIPAAGYAMLDPKQRKRLRGINRR